MKKLLTLPILLLALHIAQAQCGINYTYDAAGNRFKRAWINNCYINNGGQEAAPITFEGVVLYPSPTTGAFRIQAEEALPEAAQLTIFDGSGKQHLSGKLGDGFFDISAYPPGVYYVRLEEEGQRSKVLAVVKTDY